MTINEAPPVVPYPPVPPYGPGAPAPLPYPAPPRRRRGVLGAVAALGVVGLLAGVGVGAFAAGRSSVPAPVTPPALAPRAAAAPVVTPEDAQAKTCGVLRADYETVSNAIDSANKLDKRPWTDPELLAAINALVDSSNRLAVGLESSLSPSTPDDLRTAITSYIAGLRALSITERNHASNLQINGVGLFYNQVVDAPLKLCGIPS